MEKIHIDEVREEATRGKFYVEDDGEIIYIASSEGDVYVCDFYNLMDEGRVFHRKDNCEANAILLAHEHNTHKMLLDALKKLAKACSLNKDTARVLTDSFEAIEEASYVEVEVQEGWEKR